MKKIFIFILLAASLCSLAAMAQAPYVAENAPLDQPFTTNATEANRIETASKPYIDKARQSYPQAKKRFLAGLPPKHSLFVTISLRDRTGNYEQAFIAVQKIEGGNITGRIWNDIAVVSGYKFGDRYTFPESELIDWLITHPDGTEEGNFVGKFLDEYQKTNKASQWGTAPNRQKTAPSSR